MSAARSLAAGRLTALVPITANGWNGVESGLRLFEEEQHLSSVPLSCRWTLGRKLHGYGLSTSHICSQENQLTIADAYVQKVRSILPYIPTVLHNYDPLAAMNCTLGTSWPQAVTVRINVICSAKLSHFPNIADGQLVTIAISRPTKSGCFQNGSESAHASIRSTTCCRPRRQKQQAPYGR
jgi:hypothetical protein